MATVEELLDMPVDELAKCAHIQSHPSDLAVLEARLDSLLHKCLYCIHAQHPRSLSVLLFLFLQSLNAQPERTAHALLRPSRDGTCIELFTHLNAQFLAKMNAPFRRAVDMEVYIDVLQTLCGLTMPVRERIGGGVGLELVTFMHDVDQHTDDYRLSRGCASALITLLRGSRSNKNRISLECHCLAEALQSSCDVFFQMQCVEILFRLYTHNVTVLAQSRMSHYIRQCVSTLPNDTSLLARIREAVDDFNTHYNSNRVLPFTILRVEAADQYEVCGHTTVYFSPHLLMIMLPGGDGHSVTIPLEHIRSIKLSKDHSLGLRLLAIPTQLSQLMSTSPAAEAEAGADVLHIYLTQTTLQRLRASPVHYWIDERRRTSPYRPPYATAVFTDAAAVSSSLWHRTADEDACAMRHTESVPSAPRNTATEALMHTTQPLLPSSSASSSSAVAHMSSAREGEDCRVRCTSGSGVREPPRAHPHAEDREEQQWQQQQEEAMRHRSSQSTGSAARGASAKEDEEELREENSNNNTKNARHVNEDRRGELRRAREDAGRWTAHVPPAHSHAACGENGRAHSGEKDRDALMRGNGLPSQNSSATRTASTRAASSMQDTSSGTHNTSRPTHSAHAHGDDSHNSNISSNVCNEVNTTPAGSSSSLQQLHCAAAVKTAQMHEDQVVALRRAGDEMQQLIDAWQAHNARERDGLDASFREDVTLVRRAEGELKAFAAEQVRGLNTELEEVQALGESLKAEVDRLREQVAAVVGKSEGIEESCLARLKRTVDTKVQRMQADLNTLLDKADPLRDVEQKLLRQLDHAHSIDGRREKMIVTVSEPAKARRLDYS